MEQSNPAVLGPVEPTVRPHSGGWMLPQEAERLAELWCAGQPLDDLPQWRTAMQVLMRELNNARALGREAAAYKWGYEYLQERMRSLGRMGWAEDCDEEIAHRIAV